MTEAGRWRCGSELKWNSWHVRRNGDKSRTALPTCFSLDDFQERFSTGSCPVFAYVDLPPAGGGRWGAVPPAAGSGEVTAHSVPPSNLPPLGGGNSYEGCSF